MPNQITVQYVTGGFILHEHVDDKTTIEIFNSPGKLNKALRSATEELSLLPKKTDEAADE